MKHRVAWLVPLLLVFGLVVLACGGDGKDEPPAAQAGVPRSFAMGLSSLPPELTEEKYAEAFELAASAGEVILIRRVPPWEDLLTGDLSDSVAQTTQREMELAKEHDLEIFFAIDATARSEDGDHLAGLPAEMPGAAFADDEVRKAFLSYARYVAVNYRPGYLAIGVEVNEYQQAEPEDFEAFVSLYHEAYQAVKELSPETLVFPTFQLEKLHGLLPVDDPDPPQWQVISRFETADLLAVSSYPGLAYSRLGEIPDDHYSALTSYTGRPIIIAEMGYSSEGNGGDGAETQQAAFLRRALDEADQLDMPLVVWFAGQDPSFAADKPIEPLEQNGLLRQDGSTKTAWLVWAEAAQRPWRGALSSRGSRSSRVLKRAEFLLSRGIGFGLSLSG